MESSDSLLGWYPTVNMEMSFKGTPHALQCDFKGFFKKKKKKKKIQPVGMNLATDPCAACLFLPVCRYMYVVIPAGDTASGSRGHAAATATAALYIRTPRVPVIWTGNLLKRLSFNTVSWTKMTIFFF